jgi:uncharacterized protein with von Willebrand factor type A (vWA) domain
MEDIRKLAENIGNDMQKLLSQFEKNLGDVMQSNNSIVTEMQKDVNDLLTSLRKGDSKPVDDIIKKYGDNNR